MAVLDLGEESEPNVLNSPDVDKDLNYVVRWLRNQKHYFEDHPTARATIVSVVQEVIQPKPLPTPALTPCNSNTPSEQAPTLLPSQHIAQEEPGRDDQVPPPLVSQHVAREGEFDYDDPANQHNSVSRGHHDESSPAAQQGLEQGSQLSKHAYVEVADDCGSEQSTGSQHLSSPDGWPPADHGNDLHDQDARPNIQSSEQAATSLVQYESDTSECPSRKRKHTFEGRRGSKRPHIEAVDITKVELGSRSLQCPNTLELRLGTVQDERHGQQSEISEAGGDARPSIAVVTRPVPLQTIVRSQRPSGALDVSLSDSGGDQFSELSASLRAKVGRIADTATLAAIWDYLNYQRTPLSSADNSDGALKGDAGPDIVLASDQRLRELKTRIIRDEDEEKSVKQRQTAVRISKRVALAELVSKYIEERDARRAIPKKKRKKQLPGSSLKDRFIDLLFPETIKYKDELLREKAQGMQVIKDKGPRADAKGKLKYWIQLGEPLAEIAQRYDIAALALLPEYLTDKDLHSLPRSQIQLFLDYIDLVRPSLKEQSCNLSIVLRQILDHQLSPQRLVLETLTSNLLPQLRNRPLEELFQFDTEIVNSPQADTVVGPSSDQGPANEQLLYSQGAMESVQIIRANYTSESCQWQSSSAEIEDGNLSDSTTTYHKKSDYHQELDQQFKRYMEDPSYFEDIDQSTQLQPGHGRGFLNPQDYYVQDADWRAQQPSTNFEGELPNSQDGSLLAQEQPGLSEAESSDFNFLINYSPQNTPSIASTSPSHSQGQNLPEHIVEWTGYDQSARTVNPRDILRTSV